MDLGTLPEWLGDSRLVIFVGDGGVGKTTCAASAAVAAARAGKRVCVLTIDPAPRLADALGLDALSDTPAPIEPSSIGAESGGSLDALRLDTQATFDRLVRSLAPTEASARTILDNPIYRTIAGQLGGADAYMAFQRVYELDLNDTYDLLIIDTPPAAHADELLSAPARLRSLVDTGAAKILADPAIAALRAGSKLAAGAIRAIIVAVSRVAGVELTDRVAEFASAFEDILGGLAKRADLVGELLRGPQSRFVHVTTAGNARVDEARNIENSLALHGIHVAARIVNRVVPAGGRLPTLSISAPGGTSEALREIHVRLERLRSRQDTAIAALRRRATPLQVLREDPAAQNRGAREMLVRLSDALCRATA
jgi:anion-transporting  ArsA/GET3 family ATPase